MGLILCIKQNSTFEISELISIVAIVVNSILAVWIVRTIQNRLANKRVLKDHFIVEVKDIRQTYQDQLNRIYSGKCKAKSLISWFKLMNIKVADLMDHISRIYGVNKDLLNPYQLSLRSLILSNSEFEEQFKSGKPVEYSEESKQSIIQFQQLYNHLFNDLIVAINDAH